MSDRDRRKHPRVPTDNIVSYVCIDSEGQAVAEGMGRTLNISQGGLLLESTREIASDYILIMSIDLEDNLLETKGKVAHCRCAGPNTFLTGIQFQGPRQEVTRVIKNFVLDYHRRKARKNLTQVKNDATP
jgi:hypothetical protein